MELDYIYIGNMVKNYRVKNKLSQEKLAEITGLGNRHISKIENATTKLSLAALITLANALEVTPDRLLKDEIYKSKEYIRDEFASLLEDCTDDEIYVLYHSAKSIKDSIRKRDKFCDH